MGGASETHCVFAAHWPLSAGTFLLALLSVIEISSSAKSLTTIRFVAPIYSLQIWFFVVHVLGQVFALHARMRTTQGAALQRQLSYLMAFNLLCVLILLSDRFLARLSGGYRGFTFSAQTLD